MMAINPGTILTPGPRTWLAGSPFASDYNNWAEEFNVLGVPANEVITFKGAGWAHIKTDDMGNRSELFSFETSRGFADYMAAVAYQMGFGETRPVKGTLERLIADPLTPGSFRVWKAEGVTLQSGGAVLIAGNRVQIAYHALVPYWTDCGSEIPTADVLGDGAGNTRVDGNGNTRVPG